MNPGKGICVNLGSIIRGSYENEGTLAGTNAATGAAAQRDPSQVYGIQRRQVLLPKVGAYA